jgi:surfactin synthase thioesterase subunit
MLAELAPPPREHPDNERPDSEGPDHERPDHEGLGDGAPGDEGRSQEGPTAQAEALTGLFQQVLDDHTLTADSDFFRHGGHSLLAFDLAARISQTLGVPVGFEVIFESPTPRRLAERLAR